MPTRYHLLQRNRLEAPDSLCQLTSRIGALAATAVIITAAAPQSSYAAPLSDVQNSPNRSAILYLVDQGVLNGYPDGTFRPDGVVNRAELLKIIALALNANPAEKNCFPDVTDQWFANYVCFAKSQGWVSGYQDGNFRPSDPVNRVEAIKMLVNAEEYPLKGDYHLTDFTDVSSTDWYAPYVLAARSRNLIDVAGNRLDGASGMTRGAISELVYRAMFIRQQSMSVYSVAAPRSSQRSSASSSASSIVSSQSSVDLDYALALMEWLAKDTQNMEAMDEFIDHYSKSPSHGGVVKTFSALLFEYRGLNSRIAFYADIAKTTGLTESQKDEISNYKKRMNQIVDEFNKIFGPND